MTPADDAIAEAREGLIRLIELGPGENPASLQEVRTILGQFRQQSEAHAYVREKVQTTLHDFEIWFSPRKWQQYGMGGGQLHTMLYQDVAKLATALSTQIAPP